MEFEYRAQLENALVSCNVSNAYELACLWVQQDSKNHLASYYLGCALQLADKIEYAIIALNNSIELNPKNNLALNSLAACYYTQGEYETALEYAYRAYNINKLDKLTNYYIGACLIKLNQHQLAEKSFRMALKIDNKYSEAYCGLGSLAYKLNNLKQAIRMFQSAIEVDSSYVEPKWFLAKMYLTVHDYKAAAQYYDARLKTADFLSQRRAEILSKIDPFNFNNNCTPIVIWQEQGIGDFIFFLRFVMQYKFQNPLYFEVDKRLFPIVKQHIPKANCINNIEDLSDNFCKISHLPIGNLLLQCVHHKKDIIGSRYLEPNQVLKSLIKKRYSKFKKPIIGISWYTKCRLNKNERNINFIKFKDVLNKHIKQFTFLSLQYGEYFQLKKESAPIIFVDKEIDQLKSLNEYIAQISLCDVVYTIDNTTLHIAGALGIKTIAYIPVNIDWRWHDDSLSIWYDSVEIVHTQQDFFQKIDIDMKKYTNITMLR